MQWIAYQLSVHEVKLLYQAHVKTNQYDVDLENDIVYDIKAIDVVWYVKDDEEQYWLLFIKASLSSYEDYKSLCDLFSKVPPKANIPGNWSIFTYSWNSYKIPHEFGVLV